MKSSSNFTTFLLAASLAAIAVPLSAQSSALSPDATDHRTPPALRPDAPNQPGTAVNPTVYGPRGAITGNRVDAPGGIGFDELDRDRDGRISAAEFTQSPAVDAIVSADANGGESTGGRSGASTGISGGNEGAERRAGVFAQLDRNRDGYLSRDEMDAGRRNSAGRVEP